MRTVFGEFDVRTNRNKTEAKSGENSFFEWCETNGLGKEGFDVVVRTDKVWNGKPVTYFVCSYGYYQVEGGWMVYISYRADVVNAVRQHTWRWADKGADLSSYKLLEFLNI